MGGKACPYYGPTFEGISSKAVYQEDRNLEPMNVDILVEEELAKETPTKATNIWKGNYNNRDKKDNGSIRKEVYALDRYTEYTSIGTTCTQALECLLSNGRIDLLPIKLEIESTWKPKSWDLISGKAMMIVQLQVIITINLFNTEPTLPKPPPRLVKRGSAFHKFRHTSSLSIIQATDALLTPSPDSLPKSMKVLTPYP
ncbi:hypothetical protein Cgig2_030575 [Carnegiea gigantea]|uniref:Uncharacterized protein n=1 Tax=Carnegiea gigantea TaxID=171969 RepID=A0A9Q1GLN3_9CARY|nr:hypothetical protein Cgig2_030575 [Carnegiea gigantea]